MQVKVFKEKQENCLSLDAVKEILDIPTNELTENIVILNELKKEVQQAILKLNEKQKSVVILHMYYDMTFLEIEKILGLSKHTGKVIYQRSREKMRMYLDKHLNQFVEKLSSNPV